jgi:endonuclease YncB( thermonuclease family)
MRAAFLIVSLIGAIFSALLPNKVTAKSSYTRGAVVSGKVTYVFDGDTIALGNLRVRISNLDAYEMDTKRGRQQGAYVRKMLLNKHVQVQLEGRRSYNREVGRVFLNGQDVGEYLIRRGIINRWY